MHRQEILHKQPTIPEYDTNYSGLLQNNAHTSVSWSEQCQQVIHDKKCAPAVVGGILSTGPSAHFSRVLLSIHLHLPMPARPLLHFKINADMIAQLEQCKHMLEGSRRKQASGKAVDATLLVTNAFRDTLCSHHAINLYWNAWQTMCHDGASQVKQLPHATGSVSSVHQFASCAVVSCPVNCA